jgi:hydrogenase/urease accessory protein HupE
MNRALFLLWAVVLLLGGRVSAHDEPTSYLNIGLSETGATISLIASATDLAHDLPEVEPGMLLQESVLTRWRGKLEGIFRERLKLTGDGQTIPMESAAAIALPDKKDVELRFTCAWAAVPAGIRVEGVLFPYDARHRTFVSVQQHGAQHQTAVLTATESGMLIRPATAPSVAGTVLTFIREGIHHIFIGPDHILFVVALLLLGGTMGKLLRIVTAFTVAHSITLVMAVLGVFSPPASVVEPVIALSIVFTGAHAFFAPSWRDPRILLAFVFGLIHGFGFAFVLQELVLPVSTRGWALLAFNVGVEIGQVAIVLMVVPLLGLVRRRSLWMSQRLTATLALGVTAMGAFWFFERISGG